MKRPSILATSEQFAGGKLNKRTCWSIAMDKIKSVFDQSKSCSIKFYFIYNTSEAPSVCYTIEIAILRLQQAATGVCSMATIKIMQNGEPGTIGFYFINGSQSR